MKSLFLAVITIAATMSASCTGNDGNLIWSMINVNYSSQQADAHLLQFPEGRTIMIDVGHSSTAETALIPYLEQRGIRTIDTIFITHPHKDHYGGLDAIMMHGIRIKQIFFNLPDRNVCDRERPWGCDYSDVVAMREKLVKYGAQLKAATPGLHFDLGSNMAMDVLYAFDAVHTPVGVTGINDMSLVMMLRVHGKKILFTGDLNRLIGGWLATHANDLAADILKVPHHGTESTVPNSFFEAVRARFALVPAPLFLWQSDRSKRIREWFMQHNVPVYVNGERGTVQVIVDSHDMKIITEK